LWLQRPWCTDLTPLRRGSGQPFLDFIDTSANLTYAAINPKPAIIKRCREFVVVSLSSLYAGQARQGYMAGQISKAVKALYRRALSTRPLCGALHRSVSSIYGMYRRLLPASKLLLLKALLLKPLQAMRFINSASSLTRLIQSGYIYRSL